MTTVETKPRMTAAILSTAPQAPNRVVRVLQAHKSSPNIVSPSTSTTKVSSTVVVNPTNSTNKKNRKQILVPVPSRSSNEAAPPTEVPSEAKSEESERDILEEDLNDLEYKPYPKTNTSSESKRGRGRASKQTRK